MQARYRVISEVQTLPYKIVRAERLFDEDAEQEYPALQREINDSLLALIGEEHQQLRKITGGYQLARTIIVGVLLPHFPIFEI